MCCCTHRGRLSATWKWVSPPSGRRPSTMPASPPLRWVQRDLRNIVAAEILFSMFVVRLLLMSDCDCPRGGTAAPCLQMKSRPLCSWELWTPSSSSHMLWWVANTLGKERGSEYLLLYEIMNWLTHVLGPVYQRRYWRQSEPSLRPLFRPVWLCCGGEFTDHACFQRHVVALVHWPICTLAGVCLRHRDRMAPLLQHLPVLQPVGAERPVAVSRVALCGGCHGELVRKVWVRSPFHPLPNIKSC